jgi:hypothetical protein
MSGLSEFGPYYAKAAELRSDWVSYPVETFEV